MNPFKSYCALEFDTGSHPGGRIIRDTCMVNDGVLYGVRPTVNGLRFDGTDDYVSVPDDTSLDITGGITIEIGFMLNVHKTPADEYNFLCCKGDDGVDEHFEIYVTSTGHANPKELRGDWVFTGGGTLSNTMADIEERAWYHIVWCFEDNVGHKCWTNGGDQYNSQAIADTLQTNAKVLELGASTGADRAKRFLDGVISEFRIYDKIFTELDAKKVYYSSHTYGLREGLRR